MSRPSRELPTPGGELELAVLEALWSFERATARELHDQIGAPRGLVYTTIAKVLDRLWEKGLVTRRRVGRAFEYRAKATSNDTRRAMARDLVRQLASDGPRPAAAALVGALSDISPALLDELEAELRARRRDRS